MLTVMDEYTRECLAIELDRKFNSVNVTEVLSRLFIEKRTPQYIRSDNGPEFIAQRIRWWSRSFEVDTLYVEPDSPWENG